MSFEELRRQGAGQDDGRDRNGGDLFETNWEVFVARYDKDTGKYASQTFCCEDAVL